MRIGENAGSLGDLGKGGLKWVYCPIRWCGCETRSYPRAVPEWPCEATCSARPGSGARGFPLCAAACRAPARAPTALGSVRLLPNARLLRSRSSRSDDREQSPVRKRPPRIATKKPENNDHDDRLFDGAAPSWNSNRRAEIPRGRPRSEERRVGKECRS